MSVGALRNVIRPCVRMSYLSVCLTIRLLFTHATLH